MKKYKLTDLQMLDQMLKEEKQKTYSNAITLLPGITVLTCSALSYNKFGVAIGTLATLGGIIASKNVNVSKAIIKVKKVK